MASTHLLSHPASMAAFLIQVAAHDSASLALRHRAPAAARRHRDLADALRMRVPAAQPAPHAGNG
jgi:hypothetical protein